MSGAKSSSRAFIAAVLLFGLAAYVFMQAERSRPRKKPRVFPRAAKVSEKIDENDLLELKQRYLDERANLKANHLAHQCGAGLVLDANEAAAEAYLLDLRDRLIDDYKMRGAFPPAENFFRVKSEIEKTELFEILREMPKGGALHIHTSSTGRASWIVKNAGLQPGCYVFWEDDTDEHLKGELRFYKSGAAPEGFRQVRQLRDEVEDFETQLLELVTLGEEDADAEDIWKRFDNVFRRLHGFLHYQPVFKAYYRDAFETLLADNVHYVELRAGLGSLYDLNGRQWTPAETVGLFKEIRDKVKQENPAFDLKLILSYYRGADRGSVWENLQTAMELRKAHPEFVIGYDLVGEEDTGHTTLYYLDDWLRLRKLESEYRIKLPFYFHDGESDWPGDENLYDAYLLNSHRIGHGFALFRSPHLEMLLKADGIALEVCPLSNQILHYVEDLRMHPAAGFLSRGVPCVISSDDPGVFGYEGLTYDFWTAMVAWELDLKAVKQLAANSIQYSGMGESEKQAAKGRWERAWNTFIRSLLKRTEDKQTEESSPESDKEQGPGKESPEQKGTTADATEEESQPESEREPRPETSGNRHPPS